ncbi:MAG: ATP-binding protein [Cyclobacteriaceae bacterium]|nr:ATP-binding protein [Cyclobacteriaceae bacterium]
MKKKIALNENNFHSPRLTELRYQVAGGEGLNLEFKRRASDPEKIVRELVAFANTGGGTLLVGVADDGSIPGVKYPEEEAFVIRRAVENLIRPSLRFTEELIPVAPNRYVLAYHIQAGKKLPYQVKQAEGLICYVRINDQSIKASAEMKAVLRQRHRKRNMLIRYGEHEQLLMQYLSRNQFITLQDFSNLTKLSRKQASRKLVYLVLANLLKLTPTGKGDLYSLAFVAQEGR